MIQRRQDEMHQRILRLEADHDREKKRVDHVAAELQRVEGHHEQQAQQLFAIQEAAGRAALELGASGNLPDAFPRIIRDLVATIAVSSVFELGDDLQYPTDELRDRAEALQAGSLKRKSTGPVAVGPSTKKARM
jgi:hypothetical protein